MGAVGVVYGDIGTSPLYAIKECLSPASPHAMQLTPDNVLGVLSLIIWALTILVSIKYLSFVMRADNRGEGGILAILALAVPDRQPSGNQRKIRASLIAMGIFGAALLYGDGILTPAVSILSAVEGLNVATPLFKSYVVPITVVVLIFLFASQRFGTGGVGAVFGPVMLFWFLTIAALGVTGILKHPQVIAAVNPWHGISFFVRNGWPGFVVLGTVFLAVTGAEALYADMGHFGRRPIHRAWFIIVFPALLLNYLGQGALILGDPATAVNPFYLLAPSWGILPLVLLATMAAVIASQALISGAFSLTMQAIQLGFCPRMKIDHTSSKERGQIYVPYINWALMLSCIGLVIGFGSSSSLAAAYGIAVTLTMVITTVLFYVVARYRWGWSFWLAGLEAGVFLLIELAFFGANALKISHGGWFPLVVGALIFTLMMTWQRGRQLLAEKLRSGSLPLNLFLADIKANPPLRVRGTAVFLFSNSDGTPLALLHNLKHNMILHERVVILTILTDDIPHVDPMSRLSTEELGDGFYRVIGHYGFMEDPDVPQLLRGCAAQGLEFSEDRTTFFLSRETLIATAHPGMAIWREKLFAFMARNAQRPTEFFRLPANRVVELGMQVEI
ncbi:MAG: potassium transporter Kup [Pedosphaera sp.]|nr:potassium transporter Kup [Pedosphaera sp.]